MTHRTHLDYASSAPIRDNVRLAMMEALRVGDDFFDPRRLYDPAINIRYSIEESRAKVAEFFGALPSEVIFTSSISESLASAAFGFSKIQNCNFIASPFESEVIYQMLERENVPLNKSVDFVSSITEGENIIFLPYCHPDTGELLELEKIIKEIRSGNENCLIHLDARFASGYEDINFADLNVDAMTVSSETWGGPVGVSALIIKHGLHVEALIKGATQERGRRAGAENTLAIKGFGALCEMNKDEFKVEVNRFREIREKLISVLLENDCDALGDNFNSISNTISTKIDGVAASAVVAEFNRRGINIHAGSSCGSEEFEISKALLALGFSEQDAESVFKISWGYATTNEDVELFKTALHEIKTFFTL